MRRKRIAVRCITLVAPILGLAAALPASEIPKGAHVLLRMVNSITTRTAQPGDYVYMTTASPISAGGRLVVPVNSHVQGVVVAFRSPRRLRQNGQNGTKGRPLAHSWHTRRVA